MTWTLYDGDDLVRAQGDYEHVVRVWEAHGGPSDWLIWSR